jgi:hypothetical protein
MRALLGQPWLQQVGCVLMSSEQKALDGAEILLSGLAGPALCRARARRIRSLIDRAFAARRVLAPRRRIYPLARPQHPRLGTCGTRAVSRARGRSRRRGELASFGSGRQSARPRLCLPRRRWCTTARASERCRHLARLRSTVPRTGRPSRQRRRQLLPIFAAQSRTGTWLARHRRPLRARSKPPKRGRTRIPSTRLPVH